MLAVVAACGGRSSRRATPQDPFMAVPVGQLPVGTLGGTNVLLLTVGGMVIGDSLQPIPELELRRGALLGAANALLDSAVRRDGREVNWMGLEEQRRAARRNPTLGLEPDRFATSYLIVPRLERVPDPLFAQLRSMAAVTSARYAVVPAGVRIVGSAGAYTASYVLAVADARTGTVLLRLRATGSPAATPEAALASAAAVAIATPLH